LKPKSSAKKGGGNENNTMMVEMKNLGPVLEKRRIMDEMNAYVEKYNRNQKIRNAESKIKNKAFLAGLTEKEINFIKVYELGDMGGDPRMYLSKTYGNMNIKRREELESFVNNLQKKKIRFNKFCESIS
jgi:hypothetical protein